MITKKQRKALEILHEYPGLIASHFAMLYFTEPDQQYLFTAVSNVGNGAAPGVKAWLCAGSLLGKLAKQGYVRRVFKAGKWKFYLTEKGQQTI